MKRAGFTMIELIFVIVILGILSAIALPKFIGVSEQAKAGKCKALVGTLNRTVGPAMWADSIVNGSDGSLLTEYSNATGITTEIRLQIDVPSECEPAAPTTTAFGRAQSVVTIGTQAYDVNFTDGNSSSAATWTWSKQ